MRDLFFSILRFCVLAVLLTACAQQQGYVTITGYAQGGTYAVKFNTDGVHADPSEIAADIEEILQSIDKSLSGYNRNSLLSRFNAGEAIIPDSLFLDIYSRAYDIYELTGGCVDPASAPLFDMWGFGFTSENLPSPEKVDSALSVCGLKRLRRDMGGAVSDAGTLLPADLVGGEGKTYSPKLNYNAIAQGYSCDVVARYLYSIGVKDMMVDIGEIFCDGLNPSGRPWTIGIDRPVDGNNTPGADVQEIFHVPAGPHGVVTSGNYRKFYIRDGHKYSHSIDPRTGYPVEHNLLSATVVAPDATLADAFATYCMVVGLETSVELISSIPELEACLIYDKDGELVTWCSDGFVLVTSQK
jgi:thiamine biosynthesis lipoprotein